MARSANGCTRPECVQRRRRYAQIEAARAQARKVGKQNNFTTMVIVEQADGIISYTYGHNARIGTELTAIDYLVI